MKFGIDHMSGLANHAEFSGHKPDPEILRWHYAMCVRRNMRASAGPVVSDSDTEESEDE